MGPVSLLPVGVLHFEDAPTVDGFYLISETARLALYRCRFVRGHSWARAGRWFGSVNRVDAVGMQWTFVLENMVMDNFGDLVPVDGGVL